jgi:hypothetical protein
MYTGQNKTEDFMAEDFMAKGFYGQGILWPRDFMAKGFYGQGKVAKEEYDWTSKKKQRQKRKRHPHMAIRANKTKSVTRRREGGRRYVCIGVCRLLVIGSWLVLLHWQTPIRLPIGCW